MHTIEKLHTAVGTETFVSTAATISLAVVRARLVWIKGYSI
jgi:hypothetical protein